MSMSKSLLSVSICGWLLSILRAPRGTGVYPLGYGEQRLSSQHFDRDENTGNTTCEANQQYMNKVRISAKQRYSATDSCNHIINNGLGFQLSDLMELLHALILQTNDSSLAIRQLTDQLGVDSFGARIRAIQQLSILYDKYAANDATSD